MSLSGKTQIEQYNEREKIIDDLFENINKVSKELAFTRRAFRPELEEKLERLTMNYNMLIEKRNKNRIPSLRVPGPQSESEKEDLLRLINSV